MSYDWKPLVRQVTVMVSMIAVASPSFAVDENPETGCEAFANYRTSYYESLGENDAGLPTVTRDSVAIAWELIGAAQDCLTDRGVAFERTSTYALKITPGKENELAATALSLDQQTSGRTVYDVGFFLRKPFAAGGFEGNVMYLPHSAVLGQIDMVTRHELHHARAHSYRLKGDRRLRHLWVFGADTMFIDEVLAYAEGGLNDENAPAMLTWSYGMAEEYVASTRALIADPEALVADGAEGERCEMNERLRADIAAMLDCVTQAMEDSELQQLRLCDGPVTTPRAVCGSTM